MDSWKLYWSTVWVNVLSDFPPLQTRHTDPHHRLIRFFINGTWCCSLKFDFSFFSWSELLELTAQFLLTLQICLNLTNTPLLSRTNWRQTSRAAETRLVLVCILNSTALIPSAQQTHDALPSFSFELAQFHSAVLFLHRCFTVKALQAAEIATPGGLLMWNLYRKCSL